LCHHGQWGNVFGVFVIPMSAEFGWQRGTISLAAAFGLLVSGLSQPFAGRLHDRWGGRTLILVSLVLSGLCTVALALTTHLLFFILLFGVLRSMAMSGCSLSISSALLAKWFHRKRATAVALNSAGASVGGLLFIPLTAWVIQSISWRIAWVMLGLLFLVLALPLAWACLRNDPAEMGLRPDGDAQSTADGQAGPARLAPLETASWRDAFGSLPIWQLCGGYFVCGFSVALVATHFVPFAIERGFSPTLAASAYGLMSGLNVVGVLAAGVLSDRWGRKISLGGVYALRGCAFLALILVPGHWSLWLFVVVLGFSWWASLPLTSALTADVYGLRHLGTLNGVVFLGHQMGGALSIQLGGLLHDLTGSYELPFAVAGLLLFIASLASFAINERKYAMG
ncbi:MAG: MFS transporter, partial [Candidatus Tectomicrobia bacterium]|nr:MFS transporter [Candidatus Tectomicrobia bacterium]